MSHRSNEYISVVQPLSKAILENIHMKNETAAISVNPSRRKLSVRHRLLVAGAVFVGLLFTLSAMVNFVERDDLTEVAGPVRHIERKKYWEDVVLYLQIEGVSGRFKYEADDPGFVEFEAALVEGISARLLVDTASLEMDHPAAIFEAEVADELLIRFDETSRSHNQETWYVLLMGPVFCFLGGWIWHRATRPLPSPEQAAAYEARILQIAEKHWVLFSVVYVVNTIRKWGEEIPKFGDLFTALLFFWILPLYLIFVYVTAQSYRAFVAVFCFSYWILLAGLLMAAVVMPEFPGGEEYSDLGETGSRLTNAYILLNLAYGGAMWLWGTLTYEPEETVK